MESPARSRTFSRGQITRKNKNIEEENIRLKDMLKQSLSREADALRKLKHLQLKYLEVLSKTNGTSLRETPPMDRKTHYKLNSNGIANNSSAPESNDDSTHTTFPQFIIHQDQDDKDETGDNSGVTENGIDKVENVSFEINGVASLAPLPQGLRDVRHEREKPPYSLKGKRKTFTRSPMQRHHLLGVTSSLNSTKQMSFSDEHINELHKLNSEPLNRSNGSNKAFWKKKTRQVVDSEESNLSFESLFKRFQESSYIQPDPLKQYLDQHWSNICTDPTCSEQEKKYRDAVWEVFQAETNFLTCQLQPLEQVYKNFLEELQFHGIMSDINVEKIFGNLSELIELTSSTAKDFLKLFEHRSPSGIAHPSELILTFSMFGHNFSPAYKSFCTNYEKQQCYVKELEKMFYFQEYTRVCRKAPSVQKKDIADLLISPMQHQVHYKLLLENVLKHTKDPNHRSSLSSVIQAFKVSLQELNSAIAANKTLLELKDLNNLICWPGSTQSIPETFVPPSLLDFTKQQKCTDIITDGRYLVLQGQFKLLDAKGKPATDMQLILLNDLLLVTEVKYGANKRSHQYELLRQPFDLNYLKIHRPPATLRPMLVLIPHSAIGQQLCIFSLIASSLTERDKWITELLSLGSNFV